MAEENDETINFVTTNDDSPLIEEVKEPIVNVDDVTQPDPDKKGEGEEDEKKEEVITGDDSAAAIDKSKKQSRAQKRIDTIVRERETEKRAREAAERELEELKKGKSDKSEPEVKEPVQDDFDSYDEYLDALDVYDKATPDKKAEKPDEKKDTSEEEGTLTDAQRTAMAVIKEHVDTSAEKYEDFDKVALNPEVPITGEMLEALAECDDPTKVMYQLGSNLELATEIAGKSPAQQMRAIAKLDLVAEKKPPKPTEITQAADPIKPVGGSDAQEKGLSELSFKEYEERRNKEDLAAGDTW